MPYTQTTYVLFGTIHERKSLRGVVRHTVDELYVRDPDKLRRVARYVEWFGDSDRFPREGGVTRKVASAYRVASRLYVDARSFNTRNIESRLRGLMVKMGVGAESIGFVSFDPRGSGRH